MGRKHKLEIEESMQPMVEASASTMTTAADLCKVFYCFFVLFFRKKGHIDQINCNNYTNYSHKTNIKYFDLHQIRYFEMSISSKHMSVIITGLVLTTFR